MLPKKGKSLKGKAQSKGKQGVNKRPAIKAVKVQDKEKEEVEEVGLLEEGEEEELVKACDNDEEMESEEEEEGKLPKRQPTAKEYRNFKNALVSGNPKFVELVQSIARLPHCSGKQERLQRLVLAHAIGGFDHKEFKAQESLEQDKYMNKESDAIPKALMRGKCGGEEFFLQALADGDIEEVVHPEDPNKSLYRVVTYKEGETTKKSKKAIVDKTKSNNKGGVGGEDEDIDDLGFSWGLEVKKTRGASSCSAAALPSSVARPLVLPAPAPLPLEDAKAMDKLWLKLEEALKAVGVVRVRVKKLAAQLPESKRGKQTKEDLEARM